MLDTEVRNGAEIWDCSGVEGGDGDADGDEFGVGDLCPVGQSSSEKTEIGMRRWDTQSRMDVGMGMRVETGGCDGDGDGDWASCVEDASFASAFRRLQEYFFHGDRNTQRFP